MWYFQIYAYYEETVGQSEIRAGGRSLPVTNYRGIDADTSPNKLRACFEAEPGLVADLPPAPEPDPLRAPGWFECFDARAIAAALASGQAVAYLAADETPATATGYEILRIIAVYPDGRAYLWRHYRDSE